MKKFLKNYKSYLILIGSIIIGTIAGLVFKEKTLIVSPLGDLFLNMLLLTVVPLIFLTLSTSIGRMKQPKRIGKILSTVLLIFVITSLISVLVGILVTKSVKLIDVDYQRVIESL